MTVRAPQVQENACNRGQHMPGRAQNETAQGETATDCRQRPLQQHKQNAKLFVSYNYFRCLTPLKHG